MTEKIKVSLLKRKSVNCFVFLTLILSSFGLHAQNLEDDMALVDKLIALNSKMELVKELEIHLRLMRDRYPANLVDIQEAKVAYSKDQKTKARTLFAGIAKTDKSYTEMVYTYFNYANIYNDKSGKEAAATMFFESDAKNALPEVNTPKRTLLMEMLGVYTKIAQADKKKWEELTGWAKKFEIEIPEPNPLEEFIKANDNAEKIILKDRGVSDKDVVNVKELEDFIKKQIEQEYYEQDYWFFKGVIERARAQALLGQYDASIKTLENFALKFRAIDEETAKMVDADSKIPKEDKESVKQANSLFAGVRYVKAINYFLRAKSLIVKSQELAKQKKTADADAAKKQAEELIIGKTGALTNFFLCSVKNKGSKESFKSIIRYDQCRDVAKKEFGKSSKDLTVEPVDIAKAYYELKYYDKALEYFAKYKTVAPSAIAYEAIYFAIPTAVIQDDMKTAEEYLAILEAKYLPYNKKPKDYFTKSCLYLSGVYNTKMKETEDPVKKKEYDRLRGEYYERSLVDGGNAQVLYSLANRAMKLAIELQQEKKRTEAKVQYDKAIGLYKRVIESFPSSIEAVNSYKQMAVLHEYFKDLSSAGAMYEEYIKRVATPDVAGRVEKASTLFGIANIYFKAEQFEKVLVAHENAKQYLEKEDFKTDNKDLIEKIKSLNENNSLLKMFSLDKLSVPEKKELNVLKAELKKAEDNADLKAKVEEKQKVVFTNIRNLIKDFDAWMVKYPNSIQMPVILARVGGLYQELGDAGKAKEVYENLRKRFPDHEVVKQISINIVKVHLDNDDKDSASGALKGVNLKELDMESLRFLVDSFHINEKPLEMEEATLKACAEVVVETSTELRVIYETKNKDDLNKLHWLDYRKARALVHLARFTEAKTILTKAATEKPLGPYIFDITYLLGEIAAKENNYEEVGKIYSNLKILSQRLPPDMNRDIKIGVEWAAAYQTTQDPEILKRAFTLAMIAKDTNIDALEEETVVEVQKAWYLFIFYSKATGKDISELKVEFLQKFPTSKYSAAVRRL